MISIPVFLCGCRDDSNLRELGKSEIRPMLKELIGKELPPKADDLRAILYADRGLNDFYGSFRTDEEVLSYILHEFVGEGVLMHEFPQDKNNPFQWLTSALYSGCEFQEKLGIKLFDKKLIKRIEKDGLANSIRGHYPEDAVTGYYLEYKALSETVSKIYIVLIFKDRYLVYIFAEEAVEGIYRR